MATNFMATSRMTLLRIFIEKEDLSAVSWQSLNGSELTDSGVAPLEELVGENLDAIEVYLSPYLATIIKTNLGDVSDKRINDEFLLGAVEDNLAEDIEECKPILMRMSDGVDYIAILNRNFYLLLLNKLSNHVKQVRFIQPFPYTTVFEEGSWTVYLVGNNKFVRTSLYEYFILDDAEPVPETLLDLLQTYEKDSIIVYSENSQVVELLSSKYKLDCKQYAELTYGVANWNFYNEKSKRFNIKINEDSKAKLIRLGRFVGVYASIFAIFWIINLGFLMVQKNRIQSQITKDLSGIIDGIKFTPNLWSQVDEKILDLQHSKGIYADSDALRLFSIFLKTMPEVNNNMIQGIQYSGSQLTVFLNSQFDPSQFPNDRSVLATKRIQADITDYKTYQTAQSDANSKNNGGGVLSNTDPNSMGTSSNSTMADAAWVISLQIISRMDTTNDGKF